MIAGVEGLTALMDSTGENILYSGSTNLGVETSLFTVKTGQTKTLDVKTLPEKCVWSKKTTLTVFCAVPKTFETGTYPDTWYQGKTSFEDRVYKIDLTSGGSELVADLTVLAKEPIDVIEPQLNTMENKLLFKNKKDQTAWVLMLE
jgi:hypothetical protein